MCPETQDVLRNFRNMVANRGAMAVLTIFLSACGSTALPSAEANNPNTADTAYETRPLFAAADLLSSETIDGKHHVIDSVVENDGYENRYTIRSDYGVFTAHRTDFVDERLREVYAIAELNRISRTDAFASGVTEAAKSPFRALKSLATEPVRTVTGAIKGVGALFVQTREMVTGSRGELEDSVARELIGFSEIKRDVAEKLSVDPYSTNVVLQERLGEVAWAGFAGGFSLFPLTAQIPGGVSVAVSGIQNSQTLNSLLTSESPEAVRDINRDKLEAMGIEEDMVDEFVNHPWYSPRHESIITAALEAMVGVENRGAFIRQTLFSQSEQQSVFIMRLAEATLGYHQNVSQIHEILRRNREIFVKSSNGAIICILPTDHLIWTLGASTIADQYPINPSAPHELWLTGSVSDRAEKKFNSLGWQVKSDTADLLEPNLRENKVKSNDAD